MLVLEERKVIDLEYRAEKGGTDLICRCMIALSVSACGRQTILGAEF